ncbi:MAG: hypothetical protein JWQ07_4734 [Ramlibacter sp.]|nr:hypothetical protein [Ramlibacter sp.]
MLSMLLLAACVPRPQEQQEANTAQRASAVAAFGTVQQVFQHPRCQNCHIPGDAPLQFDAGIPHAMNIVRGPEGKGARGFACVSCHGEANSPASFGPKAPPGAPHWQLPPPEHKMAWIGLPPKQLCAAIKDRKFNGDRDLAALLKHVSEDKLVLWGWNPGGQRAPVPVAHTEFVARFSQWTAAGGPCPE